MQMISYFKKAVIASGLNTQTMQEYLNHYFVCQQNKHQPVKSGHRHVQH